MGYFVGAYAASIDFAQWDEGFETAFYQQLKKLDHVAGLEHPFVGSLHPFDDEWFLANIAPEWDYVLTCIPGTMNAMADNPHFGLASDDEAGRQAALAFIQKANQAVAKLNQYLGRQAVKAVQIQSAPNRVHASSSATALEASLKVLVNWDWHGAELVIEHCDALVTDHPPAKGFLALEDEIQALQAVVSQHATPVGMVINWGRSVLETRHPDGALQHIRQARDAGLLTGVMFSGASDKPSDYGQWQDTHMPPALSDKIRYGAEQSLMTEQRVQQCLDEARHNNEPKIIGLKIGIRPNSVTVDQRISYLKDGLAMLARHG